MPNLCVGVVGRLVMYFKCWYMGMGTTTSTDLLSTGTGLHMHISSSDDNYTSNILIGLCSTISIGSSVACSNSKSSRVISRARSGAKVISLIVPDYLNDSLSIFGIIGPIYMSKISKCAIPLTGRSSGVDSSASMIGGVVLIVSNLASSSVLNDSVLVASLLDK